MSEARTRTVPWEDPVPLAGHAIGRSGLDFLQAMARGELPGPPISRVMGFDSVEVEEGRVVIACVPGEHHYNPIGSVHGGLVATLLDSALGCSVQSTLPQRVGYVTLDLNVTFLRALTADSGRVLCEGRALHRGRSVATASERVTLESSGKLVAQGSTTCLIRNISNSKSRRAGRLDAD